MVWSTKILILLVFKNLYKSVCLYLFTFVCSSEWQLFSSITFEKITTFSSVQMYFLMKWTGHLNPGCYIQWRVNMIFTIIFISIRLKKHPMSVWRQVKRCSGTATEPNRWVLKGTLRVTEDFYNQQTLSLKLFLYFWLTLCSKDSKHLQHYFSEMARRKEQRKMAGGCTTWQNFN